MKKDTINNYSWDNISINKYYNIYDVLEDDAEEYDKQARLIAILEGISADEVYQWPLDRFASTSSKLTFLKSFNMPEYKNLKTININNKKYNVISDPAKLTYGQFIDYQVMVKKPLRESITQLLSIFIIPEGKTYNTDYDIVQLQREMRDNLSFAAAQGLLNFFIRSYIKYYNHSLTYIQHLIVKEKNPEKKEILQEKMNQVMKTAKALLSSIGCVR